MSKIIVEIVKNPEDGHGCWGIKVSPENGTVFLDTGYIYEGEGSATRALCSVLDELKKAKKTHCA